MKYILLSLCLSILAATEATSQVFYSCLLTTSDDIDADLRTLSQPTDSALLNLTGIATIIDKDLIITSSDSIILHGIDTTLKNIHFGIRIREVTLHQDTIILWAQIASNLGYPPINWSKDYFEVKLVSGSKIYFHNLNCWIKAAKNRNKQIRNAKLNSYLSSSHRKPSSTSKSKSSTSRTYRRGPRGGCYYITSTGKKSYVSRSLCN